MHRTVVLNVAGLSRSLLGKDTPNLNAFLRNSAGVDPIVPAVTCPVQATYLTGKLPGEHGIVANGWYHRDLGEVLFWKQSNRLVAAEKIWDAARKRNPAFTCANAFWWFNMVTDVDWAVTPRPVYCADGRKLPDCYTIPAGLRERFNREFGQFPLFQFWGPGASIVSSEWIAKAAMALETTNRPVLNLVYLPHLDYVLQKAGPDGETGKDLADIDRVCGSLINFFLERQCRVIVLSEYGIAPVNKPVHPNRILRDAGYLAIKTDLRREYIDFGQSRAFAVSDHQAAHVYINNKGDIGSIRAVFEAMPGIERVLGEREKRESGLDHERSGELILIAAKASWFTYYYWNEDEKAPDYARTVNIHAKPGYDPCELFVDPEIRFPKVKILRTLVKKTLGFRYLMDVIPLDAGLVRGSHGRADDTHEQGPIFMTTEPKLLPGNRVRATDVYSLLQDHVFRD